MSQHAIAKAPGHTPNGRGKIRRSLIFLAQRTNNAELDYVRAQRWLFGSLVSAQALQRPKLSDPAHENARLQPQRDGRVRCSTRLGINPFSFILFPSPPGIVKAQRRTDGANPCQNRQGRFREQHNGKNGIEDPPDKVDIPGNLALSVHSCVGSRCHSSAPMPPVMPNGWMAGRL